MVSIRDRRRKGRGLHYETDGRSKPAPTANTARTKPSTTNTDSCKVYTMRPAVGASLTGVITFVAYYLLLGGSRQHQTPKEPAISVPQPSSHARAPTNDDHPSSSSSNSIETQTISPPFESDADKVERLRSKLQPIPLSDVDGTLVKHQFLHLHHMKTGGTCK